MVSTEGLTHWWSTLASIVSPSPKVLPVLAVSRNTLPPSSQRLRYSCVARSDDDGGLTSTLLVPTRIPSTHNGEVFAQTAITISKMINRPVDERSCKRSIIDQTSVTPIVSNRSGVGSHAWRAASNVRSTMARIIRLRCRAFTNSRSSPTNADERSFSPISSVIPPSEKSA